MINKSLKEALISCSILLDRKMNTLLPKKSTESRLAEAMRYSALSDGKRIRPFLTIICGQLFDVAVNRSLNVAAAIEFIHVYSLIHDDLPAMDDDDFRRNIPTCHKKFDEATAILAGDALLTYAFEVLADVKTHKDPTVRCELIKVIASAVGHQGMVGGQMMDLELKDQELSKDKIARLQRLKTGELFMAACEAGAILGRAGKQERMALRYYAHDIGLAFQVRDDILDHYEISDSKIEANESTHKKMKDNGSIVAVVGMDNAKKQLELLKEQAISHLEIFGSQAAILRDLAEFIIVRKR